MEEVGSSRSSRRTRRRAPALRAGASASASASTSCASGYSAASICTSLPSPRSAAAAAAPPPTPRRHRHNHHLRLLLIAALVLSAALTGVDARERVLVCHKGKTYNILRKNLRKRFEAGDKLGNCRNTSRVNICHARSNGSRRSIRVRQKVAWRHMLKHPRDRFGRCKSETPPPRPTKKPKEQELKVRGELFEVNTDLNDRRLLVGTLKPQYTSGSSGDDPPVATFYGSRYDFFDVKTVDYVTLHRRVRDGRSSRNRRTLSYVTHVDATGRPTVLRSTEDQFQMTVDYGMRGTDVVEFRLEKDGKEYIVDLNLANVVDDDDRLLRRRNLMDRLSDKQQLVAAGGDGSSRPRRRQLQQQQQRRLKQTSRMATVKLVGCDDQPYRDAWIQMDYEVEDRSTDTVIRGTVSGTNDDDDDDDGLYKFMIPVERETGNDRALLDACEPVVATISETCENFNEALFLAEAADREAICEAIVDDLDFDDPDDDDDEAVDLRLACEDVLEAAYQSCEVVALEDPNDDDVDLYEEVCEKGLGLEDREDFIGDRWDLSPRIEYPFTFSDTAIPPENGNVVSERIPLEFGNVNLGERPTIVSFTAFPGNPRDGEEYEVEAEVSCVDESEGDVVKISYVGSDNFKGSTVCDIPNTRTHTCFFRIAGASSGVEDTVTVAISPEGGSRKIKVRHT